MTDSPTLSTDRFNTMRGGNISGITTGITNGLKTSVAAASSRIKGINEKTKKRTFLAVLLITLFLCVAVGQGLLCKIVYSGKYKDGSVTLKISKTELDFARMSAFLVWIPLLYFCANIGIRHIMNGNMPF